MEKNNKLGLTSAFPNIHTEHTGFDTLGNKEFNTYSEGGISKRLYIATKIASGLIASKKNDWTVNNGTGIVSTAYMLTDELLKQENE